MNCPVCNMELPSTAKFCGGCGTTLTAPSPPPSYSYSAESSYPQASPIMNAPSSYGGNLPPTVQKKYKVLRLIAILIKVFAFIAAAIFIILGLVMVVAGAASGSRSATAFNAGPGAFFGGVVGGLIMFIYGVFVFVFLYAYSEWMYVFMDIEENTRITNAMLSERR